MKVSVVIPLYNGAEYIRRSIQSVLEQSYTDFELIVVDDGSTDCGSDIVGEFADSRIRLIRQNNAGAAAARNVGIRASRGEWIAFLDADDIWRPENLQSHLEILGHNPDLYWSFGLFERRFADGRVEKNDLPAHISNLIEKKVVKDALILMRGFYICADVVFIKKNVFMEVGYMDQSFRTAEDIDMWLRIALRYPKIAFNSKVISEYFVDIPNSLTRNSLDKYGILGNINFTRRYLAIVNKLPPEREEMVRSLCLKLLDMSIKNFLLMNRARFAREVIREFSRIIGKPLKYKYIALSLLPSIGLKYAIKLKQAAIKIRCV